MKQAGGDLYEYDSSDAKEEAITMAHEFGHCLLHAVSRVHTQGRGDVSRRGLAGWAMMACLSSLGVGCRDTRKSETMSAHDVPSEPSPARPAGAPPATGKLAEAIEKAAAGQGPGPRFRFQRGHEMSGITAFDVSEGGAYTLSRTSRKGGPPLSFAGQLEATQGQALFGALSAATILAVAPSTRPIGDDEQPISIELEGAGERFALSIWAGDARDSPRFGKLTAALYPLLDQLSGGKIQLRP